MRGPWLGRQLGLVAVSAILVAACGADATPSPGSADPAASSAPTDQGGTLSIGFSADVFSFDPAIGYDYISWPAERLLYETLVTYDEGTTLIPQLATEMPTISADGLTYTFKLRPDVRFVATGGEVVREMTADDVVFSINRLLRPDLKPTPSPVGPAFFAAIEGADAVLDGSAPTASGLRAVDPATVEITLGHPDRTFLNALAMPFGSVIPEESGYDADAFGASPIGTGPYWLETYTDGERAVFRRNEAYREPTFAKPDTVEFRLQVSPENAVRQVQANELDIMGDPVPPGEWNALKSDPRYADRIVVGEQVQVSYVTMDAATPGNPFAEVDVRRALNHAIDKENLLRIANGRGTVADCIFPTNLPGHDPTCQPYDYDVDKARSLLAGTDFAGGFSTTLYTDDTDFSGQLVEAIQADLAKVGITVEIVQQDFDTLYGTIGTPGAAPLAYVGWFQDFPDPSDFIDPILSCASAVEGGSNSGFYCNEEVDALAAAARQDPDLQAVIPMYQDIQRRIMDDAAWVPILFPWWDSFRSERVSGFTTLHPVWTWDLAKYGVVE